MRIVTVRRISQVFFVALFLWLCITATLGAEWWQLRGWPINWILSLDPLTALGTMLTTGTLYGSLLWGLAVIVLTIFIGRFFCGFACPLGALNQFVGWLGQRARKTPEKIAANRPRRAQVVKYYLVLFLLACGLLGSLQTGLLDPLPLLHRSINLTLAPIVDARIGLLSIEPRHYASAWLIGAVLLTILGLNLVIPRFFCRFACPLGALFGLSSRFALWRIGKSRGGCGDCHLCEAFCEGACRPSGKIVTGECVLCLNCMDRCSHGRIGFAVRPSAAGEAPLPDLGRRGVIMAGAVGVLAAPLWRLGGMADVNRNPGLIRPPGSLDEQRFLARCIRCGQCMRVCPTNIIQPALLEAGVEGLWTPTLNYRIGRGCQLNCIACGHVCPTAAIRPLSLDEKLGRGDFADGGPLRLGTAFVDRSRCLPWAMDKPCIVCQELCPVSPKAIFTREVFESIRDGQGRAVRVDEDGVELAGLGPISVNLGSGDYYVRRTRQTGHMDRTGRADQGSRTEMEPRRITGVSGTRLTLAGNPPWEAPAEVGDEWEIVVKLQRPFVDAKRCIGCGVCEHECPVSGLRAIRVSAENESRARRGRMLL
jgi:polyferredoxin